MVFILLLVWLSLYFLISPFLDKAKLLQKPVKKKQDCICQVCNVAEDLHNAALTASYSYALALLFLISASGCCTNQILSKTAEGFSFFFFSAAQVTGQSVNNVFF